MEKKFTDIATEKRVFFRPKIAIVLFVLILLIIPFYESKRVIIWGTQRETQEKNIFRSLVLLYAEKAEELKQKLGLDKFFEEEHSFWLKLKKSPVAAQVSPVVRGKTPDEEQKEKNDRTEEPPDTNFLAGIKPPYRILIIGDSFMAVYGGVGDPLEKELLSYKEVTVSRKGKVSSGLSRPDYFNWPLTLKELIAQYNPNVTVVMLGSNDAQALTTAKGEVVVNFVKVGTEEWNTEYASRISNLIDICRENNTVVFWIGLPIMKDKDYSEKTSNLNSIYEREAQKYDNAYFISTWSLLADENGDFAAYLPDEKGRYRSTRASDDIHLTYFGGSILIKEVTKTMEQVLKLEQK